MHGTYHRHVESGTVRFVPQGALAVPVDRRSRVARVCLLLAGCMIAALPFAPAGEAPSRAPAPARPRIAVIPPAAHRAQPVRAKLAAFKPEVRVALEPEAALPRFEPTPEKPAPRPPAPAVQPAPAPLAALPAPPPAPLVAPPPAPARLVDVEQIADVSARSVQVAQLNEPGLAAGGGARLADKVAAMQVPPPARLDAQQLAALTAEAPDELTVRIGDDAVGKVAFRMTEQRTIDIQLSGLLEVLAARFSPEEYQRLRGSAAADSYVGLDTLRSMGLSLRYDPVYDELRVSA